MNYYEHHLGDFAEATAHLSFVEDAAYSRLIRKVYATEAPLPADLKQCQRLVGARTKEEREAVETVLREFFSLDVDGWHQLRCDAEIARYHAAAPDREAKRENEKVRQQRTRERRKQLFETLRGHGVVPPYDTPIGELQTLVSRVTSQPVTPPVTPPVTRDATATHTPDPIHHTKEEKEHPRTATEAGRVCLALKRTGLSGLNPGHPDLLALLAAGATEAEFVGAAQTAVDRGKGFAYAIGMLKRQRTEAAQTAIAMHTGPMPTAPPQRQSATERQIATMNALTGRDRDHDRQRAPAADIIDIAARVVP